MNGVRHRSSEIPEFGLLESPNGDPLAGNKEDTIIGANSTPNGSSPPVYLKLPSFIRQESDISINSYADSFVTAQSNATIKATTKIPEFSRQNTDATTMSYATARGEAS